MAEDPSPADRELARLRAKASEQEHEIARLRDEAEHASGELEQLGAEAGELQRRDVNLIALIGRLRSEARVHEDVIARLLERLQADELELNDLRAVRNALTPPELSSQPGVDLAASFLPATEGVSGDFYLVGQGPHGLGLSQDLVCTTAEHHLTPGTGVLLYTDGVTEARRAGEQFGHRRLVGVVQSLRGQSSSEVVAAVTEEVRQFAVTSLADDLCVVAARIGEG